MLRWFKRWLYRGQRPNGLARLLNRWRATLHARGIAPGHHVTLEVVGRRSGRPIFLPLVVAVIDGERYVVSMLGAEAGWVQNVKAAGGHAVLHHGQAERVVLKELSIEKRAPVLKAYLLRAPGARPHIPVDKDASLEAFNAIAAKIPVFVILPGDRRSSGA